VLSLQTLKESSFKNAGRKYLSGEAVESGGKIANRRPLLTN